MALTYELVDGPASAAVAAGVLGEAWAPPALCYTADYLKWQFGFPGPCPLRAVVAFDGNEPAGFAGASWRRMRCGQAVSDVALVSFVAVRPFCRGRGIAAGLYRHLLRSIREVGVPVITFAIAGSAGEAILLRSYAEAGFRIRPLGVYPKYACLARNDVPPKGEGVDLTVRPDDLMQVLPDAVSHCASDTGILWSDPGPEQILHYLQDPRPRVFLTSSGAKSGLLQAAWCVRLDIRASLGGDGNDRNDTVTAIDSVWLPRNQDVAALRSFALAASAWDTRSPSTISLPSLFGYEGNDLRRMGIRQTGVPFHGYYCESGIPALPDTFQGTNLEIV
jgi:GNAT superfamily N-acetyltransferase